MMPGLVQENGAGRREEAAAAAVWSVGQWAMGAVVVDERWMRDEKDDAGLNTHETLCLN